MFFVCLFVFVFSSYYLPGASLEFLLLLQQPHEKSDIIPILQRRALRLREVK